MQKEEIKINEVEVYKEYVKTKGTPNYSVIKLCEKLGIPRSTLYSLVDRIEKGDEKQLNRCLVVARLDCFWKHKYQRRFIIIDEMPRGDKYSALLKRLIKDMKKDKFGVREIARRLCKDASTIMHHLK